MRDQTASRSRALAPGGGGSELRAGLRPVLAPFGWSVRRRVPRQPARRRGLGDLAAASGRTTRQRSARYARVPTRVRLPPPARGAWKQESPQTLGAPGDSRSGGGGSRTRVREWVLRSLYVRRKPFGLAPTGRRSSGPGASRLVLIPWRDGATRGPARLVDVSGAASGEQLRRRAHNLGYAASASSVLAVVKFPRV